MSTYRKVETGIIRAKEEITTKATLSLFSKLKTFVAKNIMSKYGFITIITKFDAGETRITAANEWIRNHDPKFDSRLQNKLSKELKNTQFVFKLDQDTFCFVSVGKNMLSEIDLVLGAMNRDGGSIFSNTDLYIYIFGKKSKKYTKSLNRELEKCSEGLYVYNITGANNRPDDKYHKEEFNSIVAKMHQRQMETLFFNTGIKESIIDHIDSFLANEDVYKNRDLIYKTGILMYGNPGTGKTSLASAIATYYKSSLIIIDMTTFIGLDTTTLAQSINADDNRYVILLEDIDCVFERLDRKDEKIDKDDRAVIQKLLQFLDSNNSPSNVIFLATTNHVDKLDEAIMRDGRFDLKINIDGINKDIATTMCKSFDLTDEQIKNVFNNLTNENVDLSNINQSKLQNKILSEIKLSTDPILEVDDYIKEEGKC